MSAILPSEGKLSFDRAAWLEWAPVLLGLAILYFPTYWDLAQTLWQTEENGHGPIILAVTIWLLWRERAAFVVAAESTAPVAGWSLLAFGLLLYALGRSQDIQIFEVGSQMPVLVGAILALRGWPGLRANWFPLFFLAFMVPLPGIVVDTLTLPLKHSVSQIAEALLYAASYPIARSGVVITIGQYQLLVADACSGLNSIFSLGALGFLYLYLLPTPRWWRNAVLLVAVVPIAFVANVVRTISLILITYHVGDEAGQGFLHGFAGLLLFVVALFLVFALDRALGFLTRPNTVTAQA